MRLDVVSQIFDFLGCGACIINTFSTWSHVGMVWEGFPVELRLKWNVSDWVGGSICAYISQLPKSPIFKFFLIVYSVNFCLWVYSSFATYVTHRVFQPGPSSVTSSVPSRGSSVRRDFFCIASNQPSSNAAPIFFNYAGPATQKIKILAHYVESDLLWEST